MVSHREIDLLGSAVINPHRISLRTLTVIFAIVFSLVSQYVEAQDNPPQSTLDGIFSQDQAKIGEKIFQVSCVSCHLPEQFGETFIQSWAGATVRDLFDLTIALMPEDQPGSLKPEEYVAILAYIFNMNSLPPGPVALSDQREILGNITIKK
mgnify:FL=1|tara:strand:+ start:2749 stop:3204 length:456 start_codon:yes stop_codon:yes gene_type:complete